MKDDKLLEIIELLPYSIRYSGEIEELLDYAKEQAERVKELEETVEDYKTVNKELHQRGRKVRKQNKRYREVINNINEKAMLYGVDEQVYEAIKEAIKALEESK